MKLKRSELTEDMFQKWITEVRKEFKKDIHTSMNLIAVGIRILDDPKETDELKTKWKNNLQKFFENDLARQNKLVCDSCGNPMEIYYDVHCFKCEKPEPKNNELNYFLCVKWLDKNVEEFDSDELWHYLLDKDIIRGNDTYCKLPTTSSDLNMNLFKKHFDTENNKYFVSW